MKINTLLILFYLLSLKVPAQDTSTLLIIVNKNARIALDGEEIGEVKKNIPGKFEVISGEHYLQVFCQCFEKLEHSEILNLEPNKQKVFKVSFESKTVEEAAIKKRITQFDFSIPGIMAGATSEEPIENPTFYYAFESGDKVELNLNMSNEKGTNSLEVVSYPDGRTIYSKDGFQDLHNLTFPIQTRGIYGFIFSTNHAFARDVSLTISRIPASEETADFNSEVVWKETFEAVIVQDTYKGTVNSTSNEEFKGGNSVITLPITLPENTVKWYYEFSASRDKNEMNKIANSFNLFKELTSLTGGYGQVLNFGVDQLTKPPGSDYCNIYLLDRQNFELFQNGYQYSALIEGMRKNISSGVIEIKEALESPLYLQVQNTNYLYGVEYAIQIVAIVKSGSYVMQSKD